MTYFVHIRCSDQSLENTAGRDFHSYMIKLESKTSKGNQEKKLSHETFRTCKFQCQKANIFFSYFLELSYLYFLLLLFLDAIAFYLYGRTRDAK